MNKNLFNISIVTSFFLIFVAPFYFYPIKAPFFIISLIGILSNKKRGSLNYISVKNNGYPIAAFAYYYAFLGTFFIYWGVDRAEENAIFYVSMLYVAYPIVWSLVAINLSDKVLNSIFKTLILAVPLISIYTILYYIGVTGIVHWSFAEKLTQLELARNATLRSGVSSVNLVSLSTLVYATPFVIALLFLPQTPKILSQRRFIYYIIFLLASVAIVVSGRRSLAIVLMVSIPISLLFSVFLPNNEAIRSIWRSPFTFIILGLGLFIAALNVVPELQIDTGLYLRYVSSSIWDVEPVRVIQSRILMEEWFSKPILGSGHGVSASMIRHFDKPWRYEMSYHALLFHTGIVGFIGYSAGLILLYQRGISIIKQGGDDAYLMIAQLTGLSSILIAYSTNPYLDALDILWVIFVPIAFVNNKYKVSNSKSIIRKQTPTVTIIGETVRQKVSYSK